MMVDLKVDQVVDGIPPGSGSKQFDPNVIMPDTNSFLKQRGDETGLEAAQNEFMSSLVKGLGIDDTPQGLALTVPTSSLGQIVEDGRDLGDAAQLTAGAQAAQASQELGGK